MSNPQPDGERMPVVPLLDLKAQYGELRDAIELAIREVCESQHFIMGPKVVELERQIAEYSDTAFGVGVSSGTDALLVALMALDIRPGDEVITTTYSFFATGGVIARLGATPVFCDIDPETYNLDVGAVERYLHENCRMEGARTLNKESNAAVKAVMPVHLYGRVADMDGFLALASEFKLSLVEDAAQAIGSEGHGHKRAGSLGDIGCFSFFPSKNLGAFGDAGMCVTGSEKLAERLRILRLHGASPKYHHSFIGGNFRLDALQAAVLSVKLPFLDGWTRGRQEHAERYTESFASLGLPVRTPAMDASSRHIFNQYVIETERRDELQSWLQSRGIGSEVYYPVPLHLQKCFEHLGYAPGDCPVAEAAARRTLALPVYPELTTEQQDHVVDSVARFFGDRTS